MKQIFNSILFTILISIVGTKVYSYDFKKDGIYYNLDSYDMTAIVTYGESLYEGNVKIPNEVSYNGRTMRVKYIGVSAFKDCVDLSSIQFSDSLTYIDNYAFQNCTKISKLTIPSNIHGIGKGAFYGCTSLEELIIKDGESTLRCGVNGTESPSAVFDCKLKYLYIGRNIGYPEWGYNYNLDNTNLSTIIIGSGPTIISGFNGAKITKITIPSNVTFIQDGAFKDCKKLESVYFEDGYEEIRCRRAYYRASANGGVLYNWGAFCDSPLKECYIGRPINLTSDNSGALAGPFSDSQVEKIIISPKLSSLCEIYRCPNLKEIDIPASINKIKGFCDCTSLSTIKCRAITPPIIDDLFPNNTYLNGILYVPEASINNYKGHQNWGKFFNIQEITNDEPSANQRCEKPTISYNMGKILFYSATDGSICHSTITDSDISSYIANEVQLEVTYNISVYATKPGYDNSETVTATLCWVDQQPTTEGISNNISQIPAKAVLIQSQGSMLTIQGIDDGSNIAVYTVSGQMIGSTKAQGNQASLATNIKKGEVAIIKVGEKSVKVVMQ